MKQKGEQGKEQAKIVADQAKEKRQQFVDKAKE